MIETQGEFTNNLFKHLKQEHNINPLKRERSEAPNSENITPQEDNGSKSSKITAYFEPMKDRSLSAVLARLIAEGNLRIDRICKPHYFTRNMIVELCNVVPPECPLEVERIVREYAIQ